ncbi:YjeJ family protein [Shigella sonnei]
MELTDGQGENFTFVLTLHDGSKCELVVNELQIETLARAIIHAIHNAEMRELALRITSLLDSCRYTTLTARKMAMSI